MEKLRVIQVGAGRFGQSWLEVVKGHPCTELAAVIDLVPQNLIEAQQATGLPDALFSTDLDQALNKVNADIVLIVTPPQTHKSIAIKALQKGFHVMIEKPMTHTYEEAKELLEVSRQFDRKVMVSQNYRWRAPLQTVKSVLLENIIGKIGYIEYEFRKSKQFGGWRDQYAEILLEDMSIHHFDIMRFLLEKEPQEVSASSFRPAWSWFSGNPSASAVICFEDDIRVHYFGSWVCRGRETSWNGDIRVVGEHGAVELIDDEVHLRIFKETEEIEHRLIDMVEMPYGDRASSLNDMVVAIQENRSPQTSLEDNIHSFELTCAAIASAKRDGEKIKIKNVNDFYAKSRG